MGDFIQLQPSEDNRCYMCGTYGLIESFYITEWCILTGASSEFGIIYCKTCLDKHGIKVVRKSRKRD